MHLNGTAHRRHPRYLAAAAAFVFALGACDEPESLEVIDRTDAGAQEESEDGAPVEKEDHEDAAPDGGAPPAGEDGQDDDGLTEEDGEVGDDTDSDDTDIDEGDSQGTDEGDLDADSGEGEGEDTQPPAPPTSQFVNPEPGSDLFMGANFWNINWEGAGSYFKPGVDFATTDAPWLPELLEDLQPYSVLRFMDWNKTNWRDNEHNDWSKRVLPHQNQTLPVAVEWQIDLCNRTQSDCWFTPPHETDEAYWRGMAELVKEKLDPGLRVYVEWSNEVWNPTFPQFEDAEKAGRALGLPAGPLPGMDDTTAELSYQVYQSVRMFETFEEVFGKESPRLVRVLAGFVTWTGPCRSHVAALKDPTINPNGTMPDVYAVAPYLHGNTVEEVRGVIPKVIQQTRDQAQCVEEGLGIPLIGYEGGSDSYAAGVSTGCVAVQRDPRMYEVYTTFLDELATTMKGPFVHYTHSGVCWGLKVRSGDSLEESPKYHAMVDWLDDNR